MDRPPVPRSCCGERFREADGAVSPSRVSGIRSFASSATAFALGAWLLAEGLPGVNRNASARAQRAAMSPLSYGWRLPPLSGDPSGTGHWVVLASTSLLQEWCGPTRYRTRDGMMLVHGLPALPPDSFVAATMTGELCYDGPRTDGGNGRLVPWKVAPAAIVIVDPAGFVRYSTSRPIPPAHLADVLRLLWSE